MSKNLIGRFYLKRTTNGNLIGEFSNNGLNFNLSESADLVKGIDGFVGEYDSSWNEQKTSVKSKLKIKHKPNTNKKIFSLIWEIKNKSVFWGEGLLCDDILIGDYRDFEIIP